MGKSSKEREESRNALWKVCWDRMRWIVTSNETKTAAFAKIGRRRILITDFKMKLETRQELRWDVGRRRVDNAVNSSCLKGHAVVALTPLH